MIYVRISNRGYYVSLSRKQARNRFAAVARNFT